jgi:hypothetical protein
MFPSSSLQIFCFNAIQKVFFFGKTQLQLISMMYQACEICHGKAQKINKPK